MNKSIVVALAVFLLSLFHGAIGKQNDSTTTERTKFEIGVHTAPEASTYYGVPTFLKTFGLQYGFKLGFIAGASFQYNINTNFALASEVNFERKGNMITIPEVTDDVGNLIGTGRNEIHEDYITVPVTAKYVFGQKKIRCFVNAGIYAGYLLAYGWHVLPLGPNPDIRVEEDPNKFQRIDYGALTGFGITIPVKKQMLFTLEARSMLGLHRLSKGASFNDEYAKNESITLLVGLVYKIKSKSGQPEQQDTHQ